MTTPRPVSKEPGAPADARRLESWKQIAAYLKRTVRTVHRWEKEEGLPVHRHLHRKQGTVYAYTTELDDWWRNRAVSVEPASQQSRRRLLALGVLAIAAVVVLGVYLLRSSFAPVRPNTGPTARSIAVMPFQALSTVAGDELLAYGIAAEVLDRLSDVQSLTVIARTSAFAFGERPLDPVEIADRLGVEYLLAGDLQRQGDTVRVRARLLDHAGVQLWSRSFERNPQGLFQVQDEIAAAVVASLAPQFESLSRPADHPDPGAYQYYLLGREHLGRWALDEALAAFQHAIELDPSFTRPYGGQAMVRALQTGLVHGDVSLDQARQAAEDALRLDPMLADAHAALGRVAHAAGQPGQAEASLGRALELDPNLADARLWLSAHLRERGRYAESERELARGLDVDPLHAELNAALAQLYWSRGDDDGARRRYLRILDLPDPPLWAYEHLVLLNRDYGRLDEALKWGKQAAVEEALAWSTDRTRAGEGSLLRLDALILSYNRLGMVEEVERWFERLRAAQVDPWLGVQSEFLYTLGRFEEVHELHMDYLKNANRPLSQLPFLMQELVGGFEVLTGRHAEGITMLESLFGRTFRIPEGLPSPGHRGDFELMFAQFLAYGYQRVGRDEDAERVLAKIHDHIQNLRRAGLGGWPNLYVVEARNYAMQGQRAAALAALRQAVSKGWRDYVFEQHNPCWETLRQDAEYQSVLAGVRADVAEQRRRVEALGRDKEFEQRMLAFLAH